jgi:CubicO group peptidase (beta-lactamase class C family)
MKKISLLLLIGIVLVSCILNDKKTRNLSVENQIAKDALTAELDSIQKSGQINGFAVVMVDQNGILYQNGFELSNMETKEAYTENTIQHIASVSKTLIGIALMKAKEIGKLNLDDPIQDYLPFKVTNLNSPNEIITIRHLATHTSGIKDTEQYMDRAWILTKDQDLTNVSTDYLEQRLNPSELDIPMQEYLKGYLEIGGAYFQK